MNKKKVLLVSLAASSLAIASVAFLNVNDSSYFEAKSTGDKSILLDSSTKPSLSAGSGVLVDAKGVKWEYSNASSILDGHVKLGHQGYMGVASDSSYGITGIESITVSFTGQSGSELWLLKSLDGSTWYEGELLTSGVASTAANDWRYVRLFVYDESLNGIGIGSVSMSFSCSGVSSTDDVDLMADLDNITSVSSNLSKSEEETITCGDSLKAVRLTNITETTYGKSHDAKISLGKSYTFGELKGKVIEFDYYHAEKGGKGSGQPQIKPLKNGNDISGSVKITSGNFPSCYSDVDEDWWHVNVPVSSMLPNATDDQIVNGIRVYDYNIYKTAQDIGGFVVVDNMRITSGVPSVSFASDEIYVNLGETVELEAQITGTLTSKSFVSTDDSIASVDVDGVVTGEAIGTTTITCNYYIGCTRQLCSKVVTIKVVDPASKYNSGNLAQLNSVTVLNSAPIAVTAVNNEHYGDGIKVTFTGAGTASQYVLRFTMNARMLIKGDNQNADFAMTVKYGITSGAPSYSRTNGQRFRLTNNGTRYSNDGVQASNFTSVASGNDDDFYHYTAKVSAFGISSGAKDTSEIDSLELMIRPAAVVDDYIEFYGVSFYNVTDFTLK